MVFLSVSEKKEVYDKPMIDANRVNKYMSDVNTLDREAIWVLHLNTRLHVISREMVSLGGLQGSICHPREVFKRAILENSAAIILVHNHPSSDISPSNEDFQITKRIKEASEILGIDLLDHVIIAPSGDFYSFADNRKL